jgi:FixJ family two-component response regulator
MADLAPTVYVVDDDGRVLTALGRLLGSAGYRFKCHGSAEEFLRYHDPETPGCVVLDLELPGMDGFGVQANLSSDCSGRPVVFLTGHGNIPVSVKAMKAGAVDFLTKPVDAATFLAAVELALDRDRQAREQRAQRGSVERRMASLSPREREVLGHVVAGRLNKQIAGDLGTVEKTVKVHRARMMRKMGVRTVADLVRLVTLYRT